MSTSREQLSLPGIPASEPQALPEPPKVTAPIPEFEPLHAYIIGYKQCGCPVSFLRNMEDSKAAMTEVIAEYIEDGYLIGIAPHSIGMELMGHECFHPDPGPNEMDEDQLQEIVDGLKEKLSDAKDKLVKRRQR